MTSRIENNRIISLNIQINNLLEELKVNLEDVKKYCSDIIYYYSDNNLKIEVEKEFVETITKNQIIISGGGHLNSESDYTKFTEFLNWQNLQ